jgi:hypothetical protein
MAEVLDDLKSIHRILPMTVLDRLEVPIVLARWPAGRRRRSSRPRSAKAAGSGSWPAATSAAALEHGSRCAS